MQKNKLTALDKCIVLLSYINDRNPALFAQILESLPNHHSQEILTRLKECPLYERNEVEHVLQEYNDLTVEKTMLFPNESFKEHLQRKLSTELNDVRVTNPAKRNFLDIISTDVLAEFISYEPRYFVGLLCHIMNKEEFAELLSKIPSDIAKTGLSFYTKITISNPTFLNELTNFYIDRIQKMNLKAQKSNRTYSKDIAEILELLPDANKDTLKSIIPADISWHVIEGNLLSVDDIQYYPPKEQQIILSSIESSSELAKILSIIPSHIRTQLMRDCLTTRQFNIISEEIEQLKSTPFSAKDIANISNGFVQHLRKLQSNGFIAEIDTYKKAIN